MSFLKTFIKRLGKSIAVHHILSVFGYMYLQGVVYTSRWKIIGKEHASFWEQGQPALIAVWHERLLLAGHPCLKRPLTILASAHRDGQVIATFLKRLKFGIIEGSTGRGGERALRLMLKHLRQNKPLMIATDGPRGPRHRVQPGIIGLARLTGVPIVPIAWSVRNVKRLKTWDRLMVPLPFNHGVIEWGQPFIVHKNEEDQVSLDRLQKRMIDLAQRVDAHWGETAL